MTKETATFFSKICDTRSNRLSISGKEIRAMLGETDILLVCTTDRLLLAAPLAMTGTDIVSQKDSLCQSYGINPDAAALHTFKIEQRGHFSPSFAWLNSFLLAQKGDVYVLSMPLGAADKKFCVEVMTLEELVSERLRKLYDAGPGLSPAPTSSPPPVPPTSPAASGFASAGGPQP
jgi:hypothetical protein